MQEYQNAHANAGVVVEDYSGHEAGEHNRAPPRRPWAARTLLWPADSRRQFLLQSRAELA